MDFLCFYRTIICLRDTSRVPTNTATPYEKWTVLTRADTLAQQITKWASRPQLTLPSRSFVSNLHHLIFSFRNEFSRKVLPSQQKINTKSRQSWCGQILLHSKYVTKRAFRPQLTLPSRSFVSNLHHLCFSFLQWT